MLPGLRCPEKASWGFPSLRSSQSSLQRRTRSCCTHVTRLKQGQETRGSEGQGPGVKDLGWVLGAVSCTAWGPESPMPGSIHHERRTWISCLLEAVVFLDIPHLISPSSIPYPRQDSRQAASCEGRGHLLLSLFSFLRSKESLKGGFSVPPDLYHCSVSGRDTLKRSSSFKRAESTVNQGTNY